MRTTELIKHLQKSVELYGDKAVFVDCSKEGLSTESGGVYFDADDDIVRIGDKDFQEIADYVKEEGEKTGYKIIELR